MSGISKNWYKQELEVRSEVLEKTFPNDREL